ncbi:MAG: T9SS C-terminal target domain-containing protein [Chitinophagaceae bacterium]|nr:MAG: T9SS C-terminal target domain-containing protein [Chitinophagaceae bacterium]
MKKTLKNLIPILLIGFLPFAGMAANSNVANTWYFGMKAGLDFSNGAPIPLVNGQMESLENTVSVSDENGQLLFYSNGGPFPFAGGVWNRNHQLMPNGSLTGTGGCNSSFQGAITVQKPRSENVYYMFTTDCIENNFAGGLRYSIIDMNLEGGLGDVVQKNVPLAANANEGVTAIRHANGDDYWIVTHINNTDSFYVFELTANGISGVVKNKVGPHNPYHAGALRASNNGQKLFHGGLMYAALYDFDNATGEISNFVDLGIKGYDAAFSPNCRFLYVTGSNGSSQLPNQLWQFDMHDYDIENSGQQIGSTSNLAFGNIQIAPDEKIYIAKFLSSPNLAVINNPNELGTDAGFVENGIHLAGKVSRGGLPNFANDVLGECLPYKVENTENNHGQPTTNPLISLSQQSYNKLKVNLDNLQDVNEVVLHYRKSQEDSWEVFTGTGNSVYLEGLEAGTEYEIVLSSYSSNSYQYQRLFEHSTKNETDYMIKGSTLDRFSFNLYPNPAANELTILFDTDKSAAVLNVSIYDLSGKKVYHNIIENKNNLIDRESLSLDDIRNGVYFVKIESESISHTERLVIMK